MPIEAEVLRLRDVFGTTSDMRVPPYQRGFAWSEKEVDALMQDLIERFEASTIYFLGAMVIIQPPRRHGDIADGQQRLTTLTIILAVLRDLSKSTDEAAMLHALIGQDGMMWGGERWRLTLNHLDADFFREHVQSRGSTADPGKVESAATASTSESHSHIVEAIRLVRDDLGEMSDEARSRFAKWLLDEVSIVKVRVSDLSIAYKVFLVLNQRGLPLSDHDILKSALFERADLPRDAALEQASRWALFSNRLGSAHFEGMLKQIRFIYDRQMRGELIDGLIHAIVLRMPVSEFLEQRLPRFVAAYDMLIHGIGEGSGLGSEAIDRLTFLRSVHHEGWRAPAMKLLSEFDKDADLLERFLTRLDALAYMLQYAVRDRDHRQKRYRRLLDAMESPVELFAGGPPLELDKQERSDLIDRLRGRFPNFKQRRALLMRINAAVPGGVALNPESDSTVEHILPRTPKRGSEWYEEWSRARDREDLTECIGNFTLLNHAENQRADRKDFREKLGIFFERGAPSHALTEDLRGLERWTPEDVRERRDRLVVYVLKSWDILGGKLSDVAETGSPPNGRQPNPPASGFPRQDPEQPSADQR